MRDCHREITKWLTAAGAEVTVDAAGNLRGFYAAAQPAAPRLLLGSHLDTVPNAGAYDGVLGVVIAIALIESLERRRLPFAIEVVGFSEEEGVRFGLPFIGSRALVGTLDEELLNRQDPKGISVRDAMTLWAESIRNSARGLERRHAGLSGISHRARTGPRVHRPVARCGRRHRGTDPHDV